MKITKPIFIFGCCNSGTTILRNALLQHRSLNGPAIDSQDLVGMPRIMTHWLCKDTFRLWAHSQFELCYWVTESDLNEQDADGVRHVFAPFVKSGARLIAKSPPDTLRARLIQAYFPDAHFIAIVRNGYAVSEGIIRKRKWDPERPQYKGLFTTIEQAAEQWFIANVVAMSQQQFLNRYLIIKYEDLVEKAEDTLRDVLKFCDLDQAGFPIPVFDTDRNQEQITRLSEGDKKIISRIAGPMLWHFGYEILGGDLSW